MADKISQARIDTSLSRELVVGKLQAIAGQWQEAADQDSMSLLDVEASVGLLLYEICQALGLTYNEQEKILKSDLLDIMLAIGDTITIQA